MPAKDIATSDCVTALRGSYLGLKARQAAMRSGCSIERVGGFSGILRDCLKDRSSVRIPDSGDEINTTEVIAEYHEFEGAPRRAPTEADRPVLASIAETYKSCRSDLRRHPIIRRNDDSGNVIRSFIEYLEVDKKRVFRRLGVEGGRERHVRYIKSCLHGGYSTPKALNFPGGSVCSAV